MSTLSVTTINTANSTTDLTLKTGNTSGPEIVLAANGSTLFNNVSTLSIGNTSIDSESFTCDNKVFELRDTYKQRLIDQLDKDKMTDEKLIIDGRYILKNSNLKSGTPWA